MEYVKCPSCGNETPGVLHRCRHCGERLPSKEEMIEETTYMPKERAGFVTFWLWLSIIANSLLTCFWLYMFFCSTGVWGGPPEPMIEKVVTFMISCCLLSGYILLLNWKKTGFWILLGSAIISSILFFIEDQSFFELVRSFIPLIILYFILQIRKYGVSCWEQLS